MTSTDSSGDTSSKLATLSSADSKGTDAPILLAKGTTARFPTLKVFVAKGLCRVQSTTAKGSITIDKGSTGVPCLIGTNVRSVTLDILLHDAFSVSDENDPLYSDGISENQQSNFVIRWVPSDAKTDENFCVVPKELQDATVLPFKEDTQKAVVYSQFVRSLDGLWCLSENFVKPVEDCQETARRAVLEQLLAWAKTVNIELAPKSTSAKTQTSSLPLSTVKVFFAMAELPNSRFGPQPSLLTIDNGHSLEGGYCKVTSTLLPKLVDRLCDPREKVSKLLTTDSTVETEKTIAFFLRWHHVVSVEAKSPAFRTLPTSFPTSISSKHEQELEIDLSQVLAFFDDWLTLMPKFAGVATRQLYSKALDLFLSLEKRWPQAS